MIEENAFKAIIVYLTSEFAKIRAGRASIDMVEKLLVDAYGTKMPLEQLAALSLPEPRVITIRPWDKSIIKDIESALRSHMVDINPTVDGEVIRLVFPAPTQERRAALVKEVRKMSEEAKIKIRRIREDILQDLKKREESGEISEDEEFRKKDELQKVVEGYNRRAVELATRKEEEIMSR